MQSSWLIIGFIVGYSAAQGQQPPSPLPNSDPAFQSTNSNGTDINMSVDETETFTQLMETESLENSSLIGGRINSTADTWVTADPFEDNNATNTLIAEATAINGADPTSHRKPLNSAVEGEMLTTKDSVDNDVDGALINTSFELVPTLRRLEANESSSNGILVPIFHQKLPGADGTISNMSLVISPNIMNRFSHSPVVELNSSSEIVETNSTGPDNRTANESEETDQNGFQPTTDDPFEIRVSAEKLENGGLTTIAIARSDVLPSTISTVESGTSSQALPTTDDASRSAKATTAATLRTPEVQFDHQGCIQRRASSLTAAERYSVVSFQFADLKVPIDEALGLLCRYLFGAISHRLRSQVGEENLSTSTFFIINDTINEAKQRSWTVSAILFNAAGNAIEGNAASNLLTKYNSDSKLDLIGKLVKISPSTKTPTEESSQRTYWQLLDDPLIVTVASAVVIAICLVLVGSLCGLVCWHRYSNRFKGEWVVHGGRSPTESEMWYDNDAFAARQKYPRAPRGIHPTYYGRHTSAGQLADDLSNGARLVR